MIMEALDYLDLDVGFDPGIIRFCGCRIFYSTVYEALHLLIMVYRHLLILMNV